MKISKYFFREDSLSKKLSNAVALMLVGVFFIIILSTYIITSNTITNSTKEEVTLLAQNNAKQIEDILLRGDNLASTLGRYITKNINGDRKLLEEYINFNINDTISTQK